jgi:hypothetical protein
MEFPAAVINGLRERASAMAVGLSLATVSLATGFISYTHISALTQVYWQNWKTAHLMPLAVDGQIVIGSVYFMETEGRKRFLGLIGVVPGIAESLYANWQSVAPPHGTPWLVVFEAHLWATVPAQAFACSTVLFERWLHSRRAPRPVASPAPVAIPGAAPSVPEPAAPAAPAGAAFPLPVPVMGPAEALNGHRPVPGWVKTEQAAARTLRRVTAPSAGPDGNDDRPPLPEGAELAALLGDPEVSANEMHRRYNVTRYTANQMRKQFAAGELVPEEVKTHAAA